MIFYILQYNLVANAMKLIICDMRYIVQLRSNFFMIFLYFTTI